MVHWNSVQQMAACRFGIVVLGGRLWRCDNATPRSSPQKLLSRSQEKPGVRGPRNAKNRPLPCKHAQETRKRSPGWGRTNFGIFDDSGVAKHVAGRHRQ